jgi:hypothetical protein
MIRTIIKHLLLIFLAFCVINTLSIVIEQCFGWETAILVIREEIPTAITYEEPKAENSVNHKEQHLELQRNSESSREDLELSHNSFEALQQEESYKGLIIFITIAAGSMILRAFIRPLLEELF